MEKLQTFLIGLLYENGSPSLTRFISVTAFLAFLVGSAFLMIKGQRWEHYETFAALTGGGGIAGQLGNKLIVNKYGNTGGSQ